MILEFVVNEVTQGRSLVAGADAEAVKETLTNGLLSLLFCMIQGHLPRGWHQLPQAGLSHFLILVKKMLIKCVYRQVFWKPFLTGLYQLT